jgi:hypothetical protein
MERFALERLEVASPCTASWQNMRGNEQVRYCSECKRNVYNLSAMTGGEALELVQQHESNLCVRFYRRKDGTVLTADCPVGRARAGNQWLMRAGALIVALFACLALSSPFSTEPRPEPELITWLRQFKPLARFLERIYPTRQPAPSHVVMGAMPIRPAGP